MDDKIREIVKDLDIELFPGEHIPYWLQELAERLLEAGWTKKLDKS